jgi:DNA-binding CsgD family transcriptional regulator
LAVVDLLESIAAVLSPVDAEILRLRIGEGATFDTIADRLSLSQRTIIRRWKRIQEAARAVLAEPG